MVEKKIQAGAQCGIPRFSLVRFLFSDGLRPGGLLPYRFFLSVFFRRRLLGAAGLAADPFFIDDAGPPMDLARRRFFAQPPAAYHAMRSSP